MKLGRHRPSAQQRKGHAQMARYLVKGAAPIPDFDYSTLCPQALSDVLANDSLGDCTSAGAGHLIDVFTAGGGSPVAITEAQAIAFYSLSTGYQPGNPSTDQGGDEVTVLQTWQQKGYDGQGGHAIAGFVQVDPASALELKTACFELGGLYFGLELPDPYMSPFPSPGQGMFGPSSAIWTPGTPDPNDGHCIVGFGATGDGSSPDDGIWIDTWGIKVKFSFAAIAELCAEDAGGMVFAVIHPEWVNARTGVSPSGLDWAALQADFTGLSGPPSCPPSSEPPSDPPSSP